MREPSPATIYVVWWRERNILKVGYTDQSRWRIFEPRGAVVLALWQFPTFMGALDFESFCHRQLESFLPPAFADKAEAKTSRLVPGGCGHLECYQLTDEWTATDVLEYLRSHLTLAEAV